MKKIGFYCEHAFAIYDVVPIVNKYRNSNYIYIITYNKYKDNVIQTLDINENRILLIDDYTNKFAQKLTSWFIILAVNQNFSEFYSQRRQIKYSKKLLLLSKKMSFLKTDNSLVNRRYNKIIEFFYKLLLIKTFKVKFDRLFVLTKVFQPYLLVPFRNKMFLIIESWDHPAKEPFLIDPKVAFGWNRDLNNELKHFQSYNYTSKMTPLKFRYIAEFDRRNEADLITKLNNNSKNDLEKVNPQKTFIYPMCTSSKYFAFNGEIEFVRDLANFLENVNFHLYVRPYPLAPIEDISVLSKINNVTVGLGNNLNDGKEVFDEQHLIHKYLLMKKANGIINVGTTFVFDAALIKSKKFILQLKIDNDKYGDFNKYSKGVHIRKYLHNEYTLDFTGLVKDNLLFGTYKFRDSIRDWILN